MTAVAGLVLAAGLGKRFSASGGTGPKVLAGLRGQPILAHVIATAGAAGLSPIIVVAAEELGGWRGTTRGPSFKVVVNPAPLRGLSSSLWIGLEAIAAHHPNTRACAVLLGDQPDVRPSTITAVVDASRRSGMPARVEYADGPGHPVVIPRDLWPALDPAAHPRTRLDSDDEDAPSPRTRLGPLGLVLVPVDDAAPKDVDTAEDLRQLRASMGDA